MRSLSLTDTKQNVAGKGPAVKAGGEGITLRIPDKKALKIRLIECDETVTTLAKRLRWTRNYISMIIHGYRNPPRAQARIARALRMDLERAFPRKGQGTKATAGTKGTGEGAK